MNHYVGLDVSMKQTSIAIVDSNGKFVFETQCDTDAEAIATTLQGKSLAFEKIGIESGCISFWLISELEKFGLRPTCIESKQMATFIALKINKTDRNDARLIADAMRCNLYKEVYHKTKVAIDAGLQMGARRVLIDSRTKLKK